MLVDYSNITLTIRQKGLKGQFSEGEGRFYSPLNCRHSLGVSADELSRVNKRDAFAVVVLARWCNYSSPSGITN